ncbi:penicillin-binding protein 1A [Paenibacillus sediminis]|uniref:Penicillin-binding protein 2A n=1 Tax=Paenibacillus sediminis TaxID=664909 RepID=A0ABS4H030_9BACL|nr:penicillin-binding protein 1A [Paenibacillus sediminis]MBP1935883.1 penicillin-binding protein 2A [Paenibacillus sediminis]
MATQRPSRVDRNKTKSKEKTSTKKRMSPKRVLWTLFFTVAFAVFCAIAGYLFILLNGEKLWQENKDKLTLYETSKVYDRNGNLMGELSLDKSEPVQSDQIPKLIKEAFVATEDKRFYEHQGVDLLGIGRAAVKDVIARSAVEGGSTITQQLAKNMFLSSDKTFFRKATEVSIAMALERNMTKDEILTMYLNRIFFGQRSYGIKAAAKKYFGVDNLNDLKLWQIATLAAIPKGPSKYNPISNPDLSKERRGVVLELMYEQGYITKEQRDEAKAVDYNYKQPKKEQNYTAYMDFVMHEAEEKTGLSEDQLNRGGYKIYTTMDSNAQKVIEQKFDDPNYFEKSKDDQLVQGSMIILDNQTGSVIALAGGRDYAQKGINRVTDIRRQPGSAFKPIVSYAPALETGKYTPYSLLSNEKQCFGNYCPRNLHGYSHSVTMTAALEESINIPSVWLLNQIGVDKGYNFAKSLGITLTDEDRNLAIALGGLSKGTNALEMAQAYTAFADGGIARQAYSIKMIKNNDDDVVYQYKAPKEKRVMSEESAYNMTTMLENVVQNGTGKAARLNRPVAGKTGTTQHGIPGLKSSANRDVWFVGYTPEWTAAVWMGYDKPDKDHLLKESSKRPAALFGAVMGEALAGYPVKDFDKPKGWVAPEPQKPSVQAVTGLNASYNHDTQTVSLTWNPVEGDHIEYRVYRKEASEAGFTRILDSLSAPGAEDLSTTPGHSYEYYVTAYNPDENVESDKSNITQITIEGQVQPAQPPEVQQPADNGSLPGTQPGTTDGNNAPVGNDSGQGTDQGTTNPNDSGIGNGSDGNGNGNGKGRGHADHGGDTTAPGDGTGATPGNGTGTPDAGTGTTAPADPGSVNNGSVPSSGDKTSTGQN